MAEAKRGNSKLINHKNVLPKSCVLEAIETVLQYGDKKLVGRKAKIAANYNTTACNVYRNCANRSHLPSSNRYFDKYLGVCHFVPILNELRLCLLAGDWDSYKDLLLILFSSPNITRKYILFIIRSCFVLLFNHPYCTPDTLDNFIASCLKINEKSKRLQYLQGCFSLKGDTTSLPREETDKEQEQKEEEDEDEEEETHFYSDFSSDEDV